MAMSPAIDLAPLRARFLAAQLRGDRREAVDIVAREGLGLGASVLELQELVVREAQREIGHLWQQNAITIAEEHMATAIANVVLARLYESADRAPPTGRQIVVACVEGELHDFPARLVADALDLAGFDVRYLGANVPTDSLVAVLTASPPDLVALSATMTFNAPSLRTAVRRVREALPSVPIAVGGHACEWNESLPADVSAHTAVAASDVVELARRLFGVPR